jgi:hypothetical protein
MGFYGNITNVNQTQFTFDKIYSSRKAMESSCNTDGVYIGRYVLVEYGSENQDTFLTCYMHEGKFYSDTSYQV